MIEEAAVVESEPIEQEVQQVEQATDESVEHEQEETQEAQPHEQQDGRTLPKDVQSALKSLKEAHPEYAKTLDELRKSYFQSRQHSEFFKSPAEARQAKASLDLVGGAEGISQLQSQVAAIQMVDSSFEKGDPQVIEDVASDYPDGFKKLVPYSIEKLQKLDPAAYSSTMQPHVYAAMEDAGMGQVLGAISKALAANDSATAQDLIGKMASWYEGQRQQAGTRPKLDDPERLKFQTERQQFEQERETTFRQDIGRQTVGFQDAEINKALVPYLKSKAMNGEAKQDLIDGIHQQVNRLLKADLTYQAQVKALLASKTRDPQAIVRYINASLAEAAPKAVKTVWSRRYGTGPVAKPTNGQATAKPVASVQSGPIKLTAKPNRNDVDWSKTKDIMFIASKAIMRSGPYKGKLVTWA